MRKKSPEGKMVESITGIPAKIPSHAEVVPKDAAVEIAQSRGHGEPLTKIAQKMETSTMRVKAVLRERVPRDPDLRANYEMAKKEARERALSVVNLGLAGIVDRLENGNAQVMQDGTIVRFPARLAEVATAVREAQNVITVNDGMDVQERSIEITAEKAKDIAELMKMLRNEEVEQGLLDAGKGGD